MNPEPKRVEYCEGQRLRAADLTAEQGYLLQLERGHLSTLHSPGIVLGLDAHDGGSKPLQRQPGVAVDNEGRLLLLGEARALPLASKPRCVDSWLLYCEAPCFARRPGLNPCGSERFDRWLESVVVLDLSVDPSATPVAPVDGALYLGRSGSHDTLWDSPYTSLVGAQVLGPQGAMLMLVGPETGRDRNGFSIRTVGEPQPHLALDRLGINHFFGTVTLSGYRARASIPLSEKRVLAVEALSPGIAGEKIWARVRSVPTDHTTSVQVDFFSGPTKLGQSLVLEPRTAKQVLNNIQVPQLKPLKLFAVPALPLRTRARRARSATPPPVRPWKIDQVIPLKPSGLLCLARWLPAPSSATPPRGPNGLAFQAMPAPPKEPPLPGLYSLQTGDAAQPAEELRLDLGEKRDNDLTVRLSLGPRNGAFSAWLTLSGVGAVSIPAPAEEGSITTLNVTGKIQCAPIKPDLADSRFATLMVLAWLAGLQRSVQASTVVDLDLKAASTVEIDKPWNYTVQVRNHSMEEITLGHLLERVTSTGPTAPAPKIENLNETIPAGGQKSFEFKHTANDTSPGLLSIEVRAFGQSGKFHWWQSKTAGPIPAVQSPSLDLSGIPDTVSSDQEWDLSFIILNKDSSRELRLTLVSIERDGLAPQPVLPLLNLPSQGSHKFDLSLPAIAAAVTITVRVQYAWPDGTPSSVEDSKTVAVDNIP